MPHIKVAQKSGEITISVGGDEPRTYRVSDGVINAADEHVAHLLASIPGSSVTEAPSKSSQAEAPPKET